MLYCPNFFWNVLQVWMTGKDVYLQMTWSWPDKTWNILCSYCLQWNTSQSKFRNHYFLFLFAFSILSQLFLIWGCTMQRSGQYFFLYIFMHSTQNKQYFCNNNSNKLSVSCTLKLLLNLFVKRQREVKTHLGDKVHNCCPPFYGLLLHLYSGTAAEVGLH